MIRQVVITGMGMVNPLGLDPGEVLTRVLNGERVAAPPSFDTSPFDCRVCAAVPGFDAEQHFPDNKTLRLMNRDAQMAVVAARLAMRDAGIVIDETYGSDQLALYGSTGLTGLPLDEIRRLVECSAAADGSLDLHRLGQVALKRMRPVLSFKILANIPICFVSIFEGIRGENGVYTPWEGHGSQAIVAGIRAIRHGRAECALVGGCDVKTHEFAFITLQQQGFFDSWREHGRGLVPAEGAAFLVLESEEAARQRGTRIYARIRGYRLGTIRKGQSLADGFADVLARLQVDDATASQNCSGRPPFGSEPLFEPVFDPEAQTRWEPQSRRQGRRPCRPFSEQEHPVGRPTATEDSRARRCAGIVGSGDGDVLLSEAEASALHACGMEGREPIHPKAALGNLFAAAAATQLGLAAKLTHRDPAIPCVLATCFSRGTSQAAFILETA